jgi:hypothetical protein
MGMNRLKDHTPVWYGLKESWKRGVNPADGPQSRQLSTTKNPETIAKVSELVSRDQRITLKLTED